MHILYIDDYDIAHSIMEMVITQYGYRYSCAKTAEEALNAVRKQSFDIIFIDIKLPDMRGEDLAKLIRNTSINKEAHLIGYTADIHSIDNNKADVFDSIETKTLNPDDINIVLSNIEKHRCIA